MHVATNAVPAPSGTTPPARTSLRRIHRDRVRNRNGDRTRASDHHRSSGHDPAVAAPAAPTRALRPRDCTVTFRATSWPLGRHRRRRRCTPPGAIRPSTIEISGATVRVTWGWPTGRELSWRRGTVGFICSTRTRARDGGAPARLILVTDKLRGDVVIASLTCEGFSPEAYTTLTRHLRNFEAIGAAEQSDPFTRLSAASSVDPLTSR